MPVMRNAVLDGMSDANNSFNGINATAASNANQAFDMINTNTWNARKRIDDLTMAKMKEGLVGDPKDMTPADAARQAEYDNMIGSYRGAAGGKEDADGKVTYRGAGVDTELHRDFGKATDEQLDKGIRELTESADYSGMQLQDPMTGEYVNAQDPKFEHILENTTARALGTDLSNADEGARSAYANQAQLSMTYYNKRMQDKQGDYNKATGLLSDYNKAQAGLRDPNATDEQKKEYNSVISKYTPDMLTKAKSDIGSYEGIRNKFNMVLAKTRKHIRSNPNDTGFYGWKHDANSGYFVDPVTTNYNRNHTTNRSYSVNDAGVMENTNNAYLQGTKNYNEKYGEYWQNIAKGRAAVNTAINGAYQNSMRNGYQNRVNTIQNARQKTPVMLTPPPPSNSGNGNGNNTQPPPTPPPPAPPPTTPSSPAQVLQNAMFGKSNMMTPRKQMMQQFLFPSNP